MKLGPITIISSKKKKEYDNLLFDAADLHRELWYSSNWEQDRAKIMQIVNALSYDLSFFPDPFGLSVVDTIKNQ